MTTNILCNTYGHSDKVPVPTGQIKKVKGVLKQKHIIECSVCRREKVSWIPEG